LRVQKLVYKESEGNTGVISWRRAGSKNDPIASPNDAYRSVFQGIQPATGGPSPTDPAYRLHVRESVSVADLVKARSERLKRRLGLPDQIQLERHFDELRTLEMRLRAIPLDGQTTGTPGGCSAPPAPGPDGTTMLSTRADGRPIGYSGEEERATAMTNIIVKAMACNLTRISALQFTYVQCFMNVFNIVKDANTDLHELAHASSVPGISDRAIQLKVMQMYGWHMKHYANLVQGLKNERGMDGRSMLDNTVIVFVNEGGLGPAEGKEIASHSTDSMMAILAGGHALGLKHGRHILGNNRHPGQVIRTAMQAIGVQAKFGAITDPIPELTTA
jgi:hypothetical protein